MIQHLVGSIAVTLTMLAVPPSSAQDDLPATARPMAAFELLTIYEGRSWKWSSGAAYMKAEGRQLVAWYGEGAGFGYSRGRWTLSDDGKFCLWAKWVTGEGVYPGKTCFEHRVDAGTIYQRKLPDGAWYIFKHAKTEAADEFNKIVPEDLASSVLGDRQ